MTKKEMTGEIVKYVINTYFENLPKGADAVAFMMIYSDGHGGKDFHTLQKSGIDTECGYIATFSPTEFKDFCIKTNAVKLKADSKTGKKSTGGKLKAEIRIANNAFVKAVAESGKEFLPVNLENLRKATGQNNNGYALECCLQLQAGQIETVADYKPDNRRFDKNGDITTKNGARIQAKANRCSLVYLATLDKISPMPEKIKKYCEKCGFEIQLNQCRLYKFNKRICTICTNLKIF